MIKVTTKYPLYLGLGLTTLLPVNAFSLTFQQSFTLPLSLEYETNPRLLASNKQSVRRTSLKPAYSIMAIQENNQYSIDLGANIERSSNQSASEDRDDPNITLGWTHDYETGQFGITADFSKQSTRVSEFDETGLVTTDNTRETRSVGANWTTSLSDRYTLDTNAEVTKVEFDSQTGSLNDFDNKAISSQLNYSLSDTVETYVRVSLSRFEPVSTSSTNFRSVDVGSSWDVSEQLAVDGSIGINKTSGADSASGWQAMFNAEYNTARSISTFGLSRSRSPSGQGVINESNQLSAGWTYNLSDIEDLGLDFNYRENLTSNKNDTVRVIANYTRELSRQWDFTLSAQHRNRDDRFSNVSSNSLSATIVYKLPDF